MTDAYLDEGERRARELGNRGPLRFDGNGTLRQEKHFTSCHAGDRGCSPEWCHREYCKWRRGGSCCIEHP